MSNWLARFSVSSPATAGRAAGVAVAADGSVFTSVGATGMWGDGTVVKLTDVGAASWSGQGRKFVNTSLLLHGPLATTSTSEVIVAGQMDDGSGYVVAQLIRLNAAGTVNLGVQMQTADLVDAWGTVNITALGVDGSDNIICGGYVADANDDSYSLLCKLSSAGAVIWKQVLASSTGGADVKSLAVNQSTGGIAVVVETAITGVLQYKDSTGATQWQKRDTGVTLADVAIDASTGDVIVAGYSGTTIVVVRYSSAGTYATHYALQSTAFDNLLAVGSYNGDIYLAIGGGAGVVELVKLASGTIAWNKRITCLAAHAATSTSHGLAVTAAGVTLTVNNNGSLSDQYNAVFCVPLDGSGTEADSVWDYTTSTDVTTTTLSLSDATLPTYSTAPEDCVVSTFSPTATNTAVAITTSDISSTPTVSGTVSVSLPKLTAAVGPDGTGAMLAATLPAISASSNAVLGTIGVVDATMPVLSADAGGGQFSISVTLPRMSCVVSGATGAAGVVEAVLPKVEAYTGGIAAVIGQMSAQLPRIRPSVTGLAGILGGIDITLPHLRESLTALRGTTGAINARLEALRSDLDGYSGIEATIDIHMPAVRADATAEAVLAHIKTLCMNLTTAALSEYENYEFTSFCRFNGRYFAAGPDGLFEIEIGDTDAGANINAVFETGDLDFNNEYQKRLSDFYVGYRTDGDLALQITTDESGVVDYTLSNWGEENLHQRRVTLAKGAKGKYWRFAVSNVDGSDFEIDTMNIAVTPMQRRIRG